MRLLLRIATAVFMCSRVADASAFSELDSTLVIAKSNNKNEVHYAVAVTSDCAPTGNAPVHPYWQMLENGRDATEPLTAREEAAFGIERQEVSGDDVRIVVRGLPARPITLRTFRASSGKCASTASTSVGGVPARLSAVFVKVSLFGVSYIQLSGVGPTGETRTERLSP